MARLLVRGAGAVSAALALSLLPAVPAPALPASVPGDLNGDGRAELLMPASLEDLTGTDEGALHVLAGGPGGPRARGNQLWTKASAGVPNEPANGERFAATTAVGDFDGDGFGDLAIGAPGDVEATVAAGALYAVPGGPFGPIGAEAQRFVQGSGGLGDTPDAGDGFAAALAVGDFNGDGRDDLAVGVPGENLRAPDSGVVMILTGTPDGLAVGATQRITQSTLGGLGEPDDAFGAGLAAGDFNGDGFDDLAVGAPGESLEGATPVMAAGALYVAAGSATGLRGGATKVIHQSVTGMLSRAEADDHFASVLAAGDFDADGFADLAVGVPDESYRAETDGVVQVLFGSTSVGLRVLRNQRISQDAPDFPDRAEDQDRLGASLAVGDTDDDGDADLAIGVPGESYAGVSRAGAVMVVKGTAGGLVGVGAQLWTQDSADVLEVPEPSDQFGTALALRDLNGDGADDLVVGVPFEDVNVDDTTSVPDAGVVHVLFGSDTGIVAAANQVWTQNSGRVLDAVEAGDSLGT